MNRRKLLQRAGTVGAAAVGGTGVASAMSSEPTHVSWTFEDGHTKVMSNSEFERRSDTPSLSDLGTNDDDTGCCCCDVDRCWPCIECGCS